MGNLELRYRALMNKQKTIYQQVDYIESTGTQYIDTGVSVSNKLEITSTFASTDLTQKRAYIFGAYGSGNRNRTQFSYSLSSFFGWGNKNEITTEDISIDTNKHTINLANGVFILDGKVVKVLENSTFSAPINIALFACNGDTEGFLFLSKIKIYSVQIKDGDTLIRDFIPCYRKADNIAGMYDLVESKFYTNLGTGEFNIG